MDDRMKDLYRVPDIEKYENIHLETLSEGCAVLEERVLAILQTLPEQKRQVIEEYIHMRDDLEVETVKVALRWGKQHYK